MGNLNSHIVKKVNSEDENDQTAVKTPVLTAPTSKHLTALIDPRSPTMGVSRTPVEVVAERERTRQERARRLLTLGTNNATTEVKLLLGENDANTPTGFMDPRSPAFDYNRTPIAFDSVANTPKGGGDDSNLMDTDTPGKDVYDNELSIPVPSGGQMCRDLRKRLFVAQFNESTTAMEDDNKEN